QKQITEKKQGGKQEASAVPALARFGSFLEFGGADRAAFAFGDMKRIDPHDGLNGECQGAPSRHPMFRGSIPRLNMGGASPRGAFPRSPLASERLVSERSGSSEQPDRGRPFGCPAFDPPSCPKRSESLSARRTCRRCTCQLV